MNKLQVLYDSEINCCISWMWDSGIEWKLGDDMNGFKDKGNCETIEEAAKEIWEAAKKRYPKAECFNGKEKEKSEGRRKKAS